MARSRYVLAALATLLCCAKLGQAITEVLSQQSVRYGAHAFVYALMSDRQHILMVSDMSEEKQCTMFVPIDKAFEPIWKLLYDDYRGDQVLLNHVVHSRLSMADLLDVNTRTLTTMAGQKLTVVHDGGNITITYGDETTARVLASDVGADGCILHVVDAALSPIAAADLPRTRTLDTWAEANADADADADRDQTCPTLATAVKGHGPDGVYFMRMAEMARDRTLGDTLTSVSGEVTMILPGTDAWLQAEDLDMLVADRPAMAQVLKAHLLVGRYTLEQLREAGTSGTPVESVSGVKLRVTSTAKGVSIALPSGPEIRVTESGVKSACGSILLSEALLRPVREHAVHSNAHTINDRVHHVTALSKQPVLVDLDAEADAEAGVAEPPTAAWARIQQWLTKPAPAAV